MSKEIIMAETSSNEAGAPPAGVSRSAYEVSQAAWGGRNPLESFRGQLDPEAEVKRLVEESEKGDAGTALAILQEIDTLDAETRAQRVAEYSENCIQLQEYAHGTKLLGSSAEITNLERNLKNVDISAVDGQPTPERKAELAKLLDALDATQEELIRIQNSLNLRPTHRGLLADEVWDKMAEESSNLQTGPEGIVTLRARIEALTAGSNFLRERDELKNKIEAAAKIVKDESEQKKRKESKEQRAEPEPWERGLREELSSFIDTKPTLLESAPSTFSAPEMQQALDSLNEQERFKREGDPQFSQETYDKARNLVEWYFHEARERGVFTDIEERLEHKYLELAESLLPQVEDPREFYFRARERRSTPKTFSEIEDEIIELFDSLLDPAKPQYVEHASRWGYFQRRGLTTQDRGRFEGIRAEFVRRARVQMEDSLSNLNLSNRREELHRQLLQNIINQQQYNDALGKSKDVDINRVSGEWNIFRLEDRVEEIRERRETEQANRQLFIEESSWKITLLGHTRSEIEQGADQAADSIIRSAVTFDLRVIQERMGLLLKAIEERTGDLQTSERVSRGEAENVIDQLKRAITNKMDFFILDFLAGNLRMEEFNGYFESRFWIDGVDKLRNIPAMSDGWVGLALHLLKDPKYSLYFRPQGFKGQLFDDDTAHKAMRRLLREQIVGVLMQYELRSKEDRAKLMNVKSIDELFSYFNRRDTLINGKEFKALTQAELEALIGWLEQLEVGQKERYLESLAPGLRRDIRKEWVKQLLEKVNELRGKKGQGEATIDDLKNLAKSLEDLKMRRKELAHEYLRFQEAERKAKGAFDTAHRVMNVFGESAELGGPSIIMDNEDFMRVDDVALIYKYAILQAAKDYAEQKDGQGREYGAEDNAALIRYRSRMWIGRWKKAGLDRTKASGNFNVTLKDGRQMSFRLKAGFEETGLTEEEWQAFEEAVRAIREKGHTAKLMVTKRDARGRAMRDASGNIIKEEVKVEDIIKMSDLQPVVNNFIADYKSSESQINNEVVLEQAAKGRLPIIKNILRRLGLKGKEGIPGKTTQQRIDTLTQMIEDSRSLHAELERLAYFEATHGLPQARQDPRLLPFSADRVDYGFQGMPWGMKRLTHLKAFWYTNLRRTIPRAVDLVHAMPFRLYSLPKWLSFDNILDLCWNVQSDTVSGMESADNPALSMYADTLKDMVYLRTVSEGTVDLKEGKIWGFLEKPLFDANSLWKVLRGKFPGVAADQILITLLKDPNRMGQDDKEDFVNYFQETTLKRFAPIVTGTEKAFGPDRQAISSGAGFDENEKFALRFLEWLMSEKKPGKEHGVREEAGMEAFSEVRDIIKLIVTPNSYRTGFSIWDEVWRKLRPSHDIRLPISVPEPTYTV